MTLISDVRDRHTAKEQCERPRPIHIPLHIEQHLTVAIDIVTETTPIALRQECTPPLCFIGYKTTTPNLDQRMLPTPQGAPLVMKLQEGFTSGSSLGKTFTHCSYAALPYQHLHGKIYVVPEHSILDHLYYRCLDPMPITMTMRLPCLVSASRPSMVRFEGDVYIARSTISPENSRLNVLS